MTGVKTVYIVRHAKSSWDNFTLSDHDRSLMPIGLKKTKKIVNYLNSKNVIPEIIISSTAVRALETAKLIAEGIGYEIDSITKSKELYHAGLEEVYNELFAVDNIISSVMLIGHNPTLTDFVNDFVVPEIDNLPTSGVLCVEFNTNKWENILNAKFKVNFVIYPRMLK